MTGTARKGDNMKRQRGFTLIELIVALVLLGVIVSVAGFGLVQGMQAYILSRNNAEMVQKAQFTLNRIRLELISMDSVVAAGNDSITYTDNEKTLNVQYMLTRSGNQITLTVGGQAYLVTDQLAAYGAGESLFSYTKDDGTSWNSGTDDFRNLYSIHVRVALSRPDMSGTFPFETVVNPRGNGARNGPKAIRYDL